jgi:hypothetical protein
MKPSLIPSKVYSFFVLESRVKFIVAQLEGKARVKKTKMKANNQKFFEIIISESDIDSSLLYSIFVAGFKCAEEEYTKILKN